MRFVGQEQTVPPETWTLGPWMGSRGREITKEDTKARHPIGAMGTLEHEHAQSQLHWKMLGR